MTIQHHPSEETLLRFAAGTLPAGPSLVVSSHLEICSACHSRVADLEAVGGSILADVAPTSLASGALDRILTRVKADQGASENAAPRAGPRTLDGIVLPTPLHNCTIGKWRWVGPGVRVSRIALPHAPEANVILLKVRAGRRMPAHGHTDLEITQVLHGSFSDGGNVYDVGDIAEGDVDSDHAPVVGPRSECISLAAIEGHIRFRGPIGRLLQPILGL